MEGVCAEQRVAVLLDSRDWSMTTADNTIDSHKTMAARETRTRASEEDFPRPV